MTTDALIILAGTVVAVLPFLGFPTSWDTALFFILGVCIIALGIAVRRKQVARRTEVKPTLFAESLPSQDSSRSVHHEEIAH
jgi:hypothetical protein